MVCTFVFWKAEDEVKKNEERVKMCHSHFIAGFVTEALYLKPVRAQIRLKTCSFRGEKRNLRGFPKYQ